MPNGQDSGTKTAQAIKGLAMQIAMQLPRERKDALAVLADAQWLVENYIHPEQKSDTVQKPAKVVGIR